MSNKDKRGLSEVVTKEGIVGEETGAVDKKELAEVVVERKVDEKRAGAVELE